jgi:hypothetical protein
VTKGETVKKFLGALAIAAALAIPAAASADNNAGACGASHGAFANVNGNFGFLGEVGGTPGYHDGSVGQAPGATGSNNSNSSCNG